MKKVFLTFVILSSGASTAWSGDAGSTAADFLKLGVGPRAIAMGEAQVGLADDVYATYWNPAGLAQLATKEAGFVQTEYFQDIHEEYVAYAQPTNRLGTFAGAFTYLGVGSFQRYDAVGQPNGNVTAHDTAFTFSYAKPLFQNRRMDSQLSLGTSGKWIQETLDNVSANAFAIDAGLLYKPGHRWGEWERGLQAGLTLRNLGTRMQFDQETSSLPRNITLGVSYTGVLWDESITLATDIQQPNDGARVFNTGIEITTLHFLILRAGYTSFGDVGDGLRIGGGLRFKTLEVDYAFASGGDLGNAQRIGLLMRFGEPAMNPEQIAEQWYEKGLKDERKGHHAEALVEFNKALEIDPSHPEAYEMMQKTYENLKRSIPQ